jgi:hypothetical protein
MSTPAATSRSTVTGSLDAGPSVAMIFVWRIRYTVLAALQNAK